MGVRVLTRETVTPKVVNVLPERSEWDLLDLVIYGAAHRDHRYGGGHLFREDSRGHSDRGRSEGGRTGPGDHHPLDQMGLARIIAKRMAFKNYHAMINRSPGLVRTIFPVTGPAGAFYEVLVSGCGEINPLENDHGAAVYRYQNQGAFEWRIRLRDR